MGCGNSNAAKVAPVEKKGSKQEAKVQNKVEEKNDKKQREQEPNSLANQGSVKSTKNPEQDIMGNVVPKSYLKVPMDTTDDHGNEQEQPNSKKHKKSDSINLNEIKNQTKNSTQTQNKKLEIESPQGGSAVELGNQRKVKKKINKKLRGGDDNEEIFQNISQIKQTLKYEDLMLIVSSLKKHFVFFALTDEELTFIVEQMFYCEVKEGDFIFKEGDKASSYFTISSGEVEIYINEAKIKTLQRGQNFGELALLYNAPRSASVKAITRCGLWGIDRNTFRKTIEDIVLKDYEINRKFMESVSFFSFMTNEQKDAIAHCIITVKYSKGQVIVNEGDRADSFYMIKEGVVIIEKDKKEIRKLNKGDSFGEQALYQSSTRGCTVRAEGEVRCLSLGRENLMKVLGNQIQQIIFNNLQKWAFSQSELLSQLTQIQIEKIANVSKINNYQGETVIFEKGTNPNQLVIVLEGDIVEKTSRKVLASKGMLYGDQFLKADQRKTHITDDIVMKQDGVLSLVSYSNLIQIIGEDIESTIQNNQHSHEKKMAQIESKTDYSHIKLEKLLYIKSLGHGQFGSVFLVQNKENKELYGLKSVSKAQIIDQNLEQHQVQQKQVLQMTNFPFIYHFYRTFRDHMSVYYLVEYINGMQLFDVIREIGLLSMYESQYYIGTMILCMEHLHSRNIIYRDLKPENVMVNDKGVMMLIDMGTAKDLSTAKTPGRTFTIIGTPHYMAPEIIQNQGYSYAVDLWSIGICLYQFVCGGVPYAENLDDPYDIYEEIIKNDIVYPPEMKDRRTKKLIETLLHQVPELRLNGSYAALKAHSWFDSFDWDQLYNKELKPPYVPPPEQIFKTSEIDRMAQLNISVTDEIQKEQAANQLNQPSQPSKDPNWDVNF